MTMLPNSPENSCAETESLLMSLPEASPVKTCLPRVTERAFLARAQVYGQNTPVLLASYSHNTQLWKMSQDCFLEEVGFGLADSSQTWPRSGMMQNGIAYQLPALVPNTSAIESGLFANPSKIGPVCNPSIFSKNPAKNRIERLPTEVLGAASSVELLTREDMPDIREDDGLPLAACGIGALGNSVVPQIPELIGHAILEAEAA